MACKWLRILLFLLYFYGTAFEAGAIEASPSKCVSAQEKERLLASSEDAFDQDLSNGGGVGVRSPQKRAVSSRLQISFAIIG